jgi:hypothetical protein
MDSNVRAGSSPALGTSPREIEGFFVLSVQRCIISIKKEFYTIAVDRRPRQ